MRRTTKRYISISFLNTYYDIIILSKNNLIMRKYLVIYMKLK